MNYDRAFATLHHARTKKLLPKKKVANETWLHLENGTGAAGPDPSIRLVLFGKCILTWHANGSITLNNEGWWSWSTKDRYNKYLPEGLRIWQDSPFWYLKTSRGVLPFYNGMHLSASGADHSLPDEMNRMKAPELRHQIYKYAQLYANRLVNGIISRDPDVDCEVCHRHVLEEAGVDSRHRLHLIQHVQHETTPKSLVIDALDDTETGARCFKHTGAVSRDFLHQIIYASWHENQLIWRRPKSKKAMIARTEAILGNDDLPRLDIVPRAWLVNLRMLVEDYILESLCFERMQD